MRVLLDENLPHDLMGLLIGHAVETVAGRGWAGVRNGELLKRASGEVDVFLTMDRRLPEQQRIAQLPFGVILLLAPSNRLVHLRPLVPEVSRILPSVKAPEQPVLSCQCCGIEDQFDRERAEKDLRHYHRRGPLPTTRRLLRAVGERPATGGTLLDIGGGVGVIHHELLGRGFTGATHVDRSRAFIDVARQEATRVGHADRVAFVLGDFRDVASTLQPADVVTLDRVVCCDPDFASLLPLAANCARHTLALSFPRDRWYVRWFVSISNAWRRLRGSDFRVYVHSPAAMDTLLRQLGLNRTRSDATVVWSIELWERAPGPSRG